MARLSCCCCICFWLILFLLLWFFWPPAATTTTTTTTRLVVVPPPVPPPTTTQPPTPAPLPFDCDAGFGQWATGWSLAKQNWCCQHTGKGCPTPPPPPPPPPPPATPPRVVTTTPAPSPSGECTFWGDPHIKTFDGGKPSFYGDGEFWIVKSDQVHIQGRYKGTKYTAGLAATNRIMVGGPFLQGHTVTVGTMQDDVLTVDGEDVMKEFPSSYQIGDVGTLKYDAYGELVDKQGTSSKWQKHIVHMELPLDVHVTVMRWGNYLDLRIVMPAQPGQDGACGNFNGDISDDSTEAIMGRVGARVLPEELLFHSRVHIEWGHTEEELIKRCPKDKVAKARVECAAELGAVPKQPHQMKSCILDVCYGANEHTLKMATKLGLTK